VSSNPTISIPLAVCALVPLIYLSFKLKGEIEFLILLDEEIFFGPISKRADQKISVLPTPTPSWDCSVTGCYDPRRT